MKDTKNQLRENGSFLSGLKDWAKDTKSGKKNSDKLAFLAIRKDVQEAIEAGYALITIWQYLKQKNAIDCRYETFLKHTKKYGTVRPGEPLSHKNETPPICDRKEEQAQQTNTEDQNEPSLTSAKEFRINHNLTNKDMF